MTTVRFINGSAALADFLNGIHRDIDDQLDQRNINASGRLRASNRTEVFSTSADVVGNLFALDYWKTAGSGSPPGTNVELDDLRGWLIDKGIITDLEETKYVALLIQEKILKEGSRDHRERNTNVYVESIRSAQSKMPFILREFLTDFRDPIAEQFSKAFA